MEKDYIQQEIKDMKRHIEVLQKVYNNLILVLDEDVKTIEKDGVEEIELKDDKIAIYVNGIDKGSDALDKQLARIKVKKEELKKLEDAQKPKETNGNKVIEKVAEKQSSSNLSKHIA
tara:strand:- start:8181 stop:8531 length:351 start_codon:yes stop_codon:yes gene_type:complete